MLCYSGHHSEPPWRDQERVRAGVGLPHGPHRLQVRGDHGEGGPALGQEAGGQPQVRQVRRRRHRRLQALEAHVRGELRRLPSPGALRRARHEADRGRRGHQVRTQDGEGRQGHQGCAEGV